ncbi:XK-related protein 9 [Salarias fasciatus]|uniref:XK-related protein n=1 Tax=Salarias fasciatus TaxID=181472 RepID=A0A672J562_SALFA|nr:XK-related protein 9 [Salarias fasciatus]XP_029955898.1 XK-related protein 9 [Salarias fasciatus]
MTMLQSDNQYSKLRWLLTIVGLVLYAADIGTDIRLAVRYFQEQHYVWCGLTLMFILVGLVVTQIFSCVWYWDDMNNDPINPEIKPDISMCKIVVLHVFGLGIFTRIYFLLKKGWEVVWRTNHFMVEELREEHHGLFCMATDLSMLKLFEAFLESVPQLLLQLYVLLGHDEGSFTQYLSVTFSCFNVAWALVDYRRCHRRSLPDITEMPSGIPTTIYLLYKLCTVGSLILSFSLLLTLSPYSAIAFTILWLLGTLWTHVLRTDFCSSRVLELFYRAVVGVILTFTFFNVKGRDTKVEMIIYYSTHCLIHFVALLQLFLLKLEMLTIVKYLIVSALIIGGSVLGLVCLVLYYYLLHPREKSHIADEVDGVVTEKESGTSRRQRNLQPW